MTRFAFMGACPVSSRKPAHGLALAAAMLLTAVLMASPAQAQGNKALMEDWVRNRQQARDEVLKELKRQGALPRNGTVTFEATVKPDPRRPDAPKVRIDSVVVRETPAGQKPQASDPVFGPRDPATGRMAAPSQSKPDTMRETITITNGVPENAAGGKSSKP